MTRSSFHSIAPGRTSLHARGSSSQSQTSLILPLVGVVTGVLAGALVATTGESSASVILAGLLLLVGVVGEVRTLLHVTLGVLLVVPFDYLGQLSGSTLGVPVFLITLLILGSAVVLNWPDMVWDRVSWALFALVFVIALSGFFSRDLTGAARAGGLWFAGLVTYTAILTARRKYDELPWTLLLTVALTSAAVSILVLVNTVGGPALWDAIPGYEPTTRILDGTWNRPYATLGHPLRLGTLTVLGSLAALGLVRVRRHLITALFTLAVCMPVMVLTAARGAWLAFAVGALAALAMSTRLSWRSKIGVLAACVALVTMVAVYAGGASLILDRLTGRFSDPTSFGQRSAVVAAVPSLAASRPVFGHGFSTYTNAMLATGLASPNIENEYAGFLVKGGLAVLAAFITLVALVLLRMYRLRESPSVMALAPLFLALLVSMATYNLFDWTAMPVVFCAIIAAAAPVDAQSR